ncbi:MAG: NAAT family transporter [Chloroflexota bacterium]
MYLDIAELTNWNEYLKLFVGLFALVSPPLILPLFISVAGHRPQNEQRQIATVGTIGFAAIMLIFTFLGTAILNLFGITIPAFRVAGGLLLLLISLDMMRSELTFGEAKKDDDSNANALSLGIVPIAVPILAGPGAISTLIILANHHEGVTHQIVVSIVVVAVAVCILASFQAVIASGHLMNRTTTIVFHRVMGLIIAAIAVEFILDGIGGHFPNLGSIH